MCLLQGHREGNTEDTHDQRAVGMGLGQDAKLRFNVKFRGTSETAFQSVDNRTTAPGGCKGVPVLPPMPPPSFAHDPPVLQGNPLPLASLPLPHCVLPGRPPCSPAPSQRADHMVTLLSPGQMPAQQRVPLRRGTARGPRSGGPRTG